METKKLILYALLGLIAISLWNAWQKDHTPASIPSVLAVNSSPLASKAKTAITPAANLGNNANSAVTTALSEVNVSQIPASRLINVHTDVLDVSIDTLGGNVVKADLLKYKKSIENPEPVQLLNDNPDALYIAESGLISPTGPDSINAQAKYSVEQREYTLQPGQKDLTVKLSSKGKGIVVNKIFTFTRDNYAVKINYDIANNTSQQWTGQFYSQIKHKYTPAKKSSLQANAFEGISISTPEKPFEKFKYDKLTKEKIDRDVRGGWIAVQQRYFLSALVPENTNLTYRYFSDADSQNGLYTAGFMDNAVTVPAKSTTSIGTNLYVGPELSKNLKALAPKLDLTIDYGWLWIISAALMWVMENIYRFIGNWGWSIVIVTILIKLAFYKLSESSYRSMAHMKDLAPKMQALKERFAEDKQKLNQAMMELYRKEKINPLGGCLPMIVQIPVFIGLYYALIESVELRQAPFMFWIHDLSAKDPYYVLPILMGLTMLLQQRLSPSSPDPMQAKMMMLMPIVFTIFFISFPSGLVLYWLVNNLASIAQQWYINRRFAMAAEKRQHKR